MKTGESMYDDNYPQACEAKSLSGSIRPATITESLESRRVRLAQELDRVEKAIAALKANPGVEEVMNLVAQAGR
jgi:hypothetical protein